MVFGAGKRTIAKLAEFSHCKMQVFGKMIGAAFAYASMAFLA